MQTKTYHISENEPVAVAEPAVGYLRRDPVCTGQAIARNVWGPNALFNGTQEEWIEHFNRIERGEFSPVKEVHNRISEWIYNQKK